MPRVVDGGTPDLLMRLPDPACHGRASVAMRGAQPEREVPAHARARRPSRAMTSGPAWTLHPMKVVGLFVLLALTYPLFFHRIGERDLWSSHEGRAAQDAQAILDEGCWLLPRLFDLHPELQKPPLYYWLVAAAARLRGGPVDETAVRLPAAVSAVALLLLLYGWGLASGRPLAGWLAAMVLATAVHFTWLARVGRIDMPLALTTAIAVGGFYVGRRRQDDGRRAGPCDLAAYLATAAGVMLKGPVAVVAPGAVALAYLAVRRELPAPWRGRAWLALGRHVGIWWGVPLVAALTLPWFVWASAHTGGQYFWTFFWHHNVERAFGGSETLRAHPWWFYLPRFAADFLPWTPAVALAGWWLWRSPAGRRDPELAFGLLWLGAVALVLSLARFKRADYLLPAFPGAALAIGCAFEAWWRKPRVSRPLAPAFAVVVVGCVVGWLVAVERILPAAEPTREDRRFAAEVRRRCPRPELVLFFRAEAHALAFHVGPPVDTFLEWENLNVWAGRPGSHYIIMPPECARDWPRHVSAGRLEEVLRSTDLPGAAEHERPLVLMRTMPNPSDDRATVTRAR